MNGKRKAAQNASSACIPQVFVHFVTIAQAHSVEIMVGERHSITLMDKVEATTDFESFVRPERRRGRGRWS